MSRSLVYSNIHVYRLAMNVLYYGGYIERYRELIKLMGHQVDSVCDLCFGDTYIAEFCRKNGIDWVGVDLNPDFCERARNLGYVVIEQDVLKADLPVADVYLMAGSLYHFHGRLDRLFNVVFCRTRRFLISEPIRNLSSSSGLVGWLARRSANPGPGGATFRFDEGTFLRAVASQSRRLGVSYRVHGRNRDMVVEISDGASADAPKEQNL